MEWCVFIASLSQFPKRGHKCLCQCHGRHKKHEGIVEGKRGKSIKIDRRFLNFFGWEQTILSIEQKSRPWKNNGGRHKVLHYKAKHKKTFITNDQGTIIKDDRKLGTIKSIILGKVLLRVYY